MFVSLVTNFNDSFHNYTKNSSHHLRTSSLIGIGTNTQFDGCDFFSMGKFIDLRGKKFGRWTVLSGTSNRNGEGAVMWLCKCDCGTEREVNGSQLRNGHSMSCGCLAIEALNLSRTKHGHSGGKRTPEYNSWNSMKERCFNPNNKYYYNYGGRGITICDGWINSFENFYADMGKRPTGTSLDRIENDGNYEPSNCRWATRREQEHNKRSNHWVEAFGRNQLIRDWSKELNVWEGNILYHLKQGKSMEWIYNHFTNPSEYKRRSKLVTWN